MSEKNQIGKPAIATFGIEINKYLGEVDALRKTYPLVMALLNETQKGSVKLLSQTWIKGNPKALTEETPIASLDPKTLAAMAGIAKEGTQVEEAIRIISRSFLVSLVSQWDAYFGSLIRLVIAELPDHARGISGSDEVDKNGKSEIGTISYIELAKFTTIDEVKAHLIDKRVGSVLRKSHIDQFIWLENRLKVKDSGEKFSLRNGEEWRPFIEITQRRHLYVHTNGTITPDYIAECQDVGIKLQDDVKPGNILQTTDEYFFDACRWMHEIGLKLGTVAWRRLRNDFPKDLKASDGVYNNRCVELITEGENRSAARLLKCAKHDWRDKYGSVEMKHYIEFNYVQALKWSGQDEAFKEELAKLDPSLDDRFKLCIVVLSDKFDEAIKLMKQMGSNHEHVTAESYREWPIFQKFRQTEEFQKTYSEVFGEQYDPNESTPSALKKMTESLDKTNID